MARLEAQHEFVWNILQEYLPEGTRLTSVIRTAQDQLDTIVKYARKEKFDFKQAPTLADKGTWLPALSYLRKKNYKIAEPGRSAHQKGLAFDLSGKNLKEIRQAVEKAQADGRLSIQKIITEWSNHCVHVEVTSAQTRNEMVFLEGMTISL
ncbi:hypothetical protein GCM10028806_54530 [Spirosoma terrae]|uniref:Peptidase M15A C-terminal domain-containing protein n=1 Tax=Spirosoma terrae TaxID=1968276 RepID=A0A6L9L7Y6_9BACT|nr:hypothetical protein [Spirosoma terrae]NDU96746.1 hypothetical protein [Spirosoma terrae]